MTDASAGRGGVGVRLYTVGGELVKRNFNEIGDSGKRMWADVATGNKAANPAIRALSSLTADAKGKVGELAAESGSAGRALTQFGAVGVIAAAGLGALALALVKVREGMQFAADLTDASDRIGVGAEALQSWSYVADEAGVKVDQFQGNLEKLNGVMGAFKLSIGDAKLKPIFEELGITQEQLASVESADQMMLILADTLGQVRDRATQVKLARSMGVEESLPILRLGSDAIRRMMQDGVDLGLVMSDDVREGFDKADRAVELAQQRIDMSLRTSVVGLAEDFAMVVSAIADVVNWLQKLDGIKISMDMPGRSLPAFISDKVRGRSGAEGDAARDDGIRRQPGWMTWLGFNSDRKKQLEAEDGAALRAGLAEIGGTVAPAGGFDPKGHTTRSGSGGANKAAQAAERLARDRERALEQLDQTEERNSRDILPLRWSGDQASDHENIALENQRLYVEERDAQREIVRKALEKAGILDDEAKGRLAALAEMDTEHDQLVAIAIAQTKVKDLAEARLAREQVSTDDAVALLNIQGQLARTGAERFAIGQKILLAEQALERLAHETQMKADGIVSDDEQASYDSMIQRQGGERIVQVQVEDERLREQFKGYGREVAGAIKDGRLGEYIGDQLKSRLLDGALDALFGLMSGGSKSEGGGFLNSALKFGMSLFGKGGGRASGGATKAGFTYGPAEHGPELFMLGGNGHVTSAAETAEMIRSIGGANDKAANSGGAPVFNFPAVTINAAGADAAALKRVEDEVRELNRTLEQRAIEAFADYRQRSHG